MITPLPVPIHKRLHETNKEVILTNEKPSLPVPEKKKSFLCISDGIKICKIVVCSRFVHQNEMQLKEINKKFIIQCPKSKPFEQF